MRNKLLEIAIKIVLAVLEILFAGALIYFRVLNTGWILILMGLFLAVWLLIHLALMAVFIASLKLHIFDILLYLAVHFFYTFAWLLQSDGGDSDLVTWTIQKVYDWPPLYPFLKQYGDTLAGYAGGATVICYILIIILLIVKLVQFTRSRRKSQAVPQPVTTQPVETQP